MAKSRKRSAVTSESAFDLATVRAWLRLARRLVRKMEETERALVRMRERGWSVSQGLCYHDGMAMHAWSPDTCPPAAPKNRKPDVLGRRPPLDAERDDA
jgi:hypothetical protein